MSLTERAAAAPPPGNRGVEAFSDERLAAGPARLVGVKNASPTPSRRHGRGDAVPWLVSAPGAGPAAFWHGFRPDFRHCR